MGLWTLTHFYQILPSFLVFAAVAVIAAMTLGKCDRKIRYIPLQVIAVLLLVLEVMKQINSATGDGGYDLYALPFHYCSLFLYTLPLHAFYRGKYSHLTDAAALGCLSSLMLFMVIMPAVVYSDGNIRNYFGSFGDFHTVTFHNLVVLYFMLTVALKLYDFQKKRDLKVMGVFLAVYVVIAAILSYSLKVNFHNLYKCNVALIDNIRLMLIEKIGVFGTLTYVVILFILTILFAYAAYFLTRLVVGLIEKAGKKGATGAVATPDEAENTAEKTEESCN